MVDLVDAGPSSHGKGAHDSVAAILGSFAIFAGSLGGNLGRVACMPGLQRNSLGKVPLFVVPACTCYAAEDARHDSNGSHNAADPVANFGVLPSTMAAEAVASPLSNSLLRRPASGTEAASLARALQDALQGGDGGGSRAMCNLFGAWSTHYSQEYASVEQVSGSLCFGLGGAWGALVVLCVCEVFCAVFCSIRVRVCVRVYGEGGT